MKSTRINDFPKLFVIILAIVSLISVSLTSCGGGGGGGGGGSGGGGAASGPAGDGSSSDSSSAPAAPVQAASSNAEIITFEFTQTKNPLLSANLTGTPTTVNDVATVDVSYPYNSLTTEQKQSLIPTITVSNAASISPASDTAQDFTSPVTYTVTAEDGTTKTWTISLTERSATQRSITYERDGGEIKCSVSNVYNIEDPVSLPGMGDVVKDNYYFAGWMDQTTGSIVTGWAANSHSGDVTLTAHWIPAPYIENKVIYANGKAVTVKDLGGKTMVSFRGENNTEINLCDINKASEYQNLSGYTLFAGKAGNVNATNITVTDGSITMTGGNLSAIYGYNGNNSNFIGEVTIEIKGGTVNNVVGFNKNEASKPINAEVIVSGNPTIGNKTSSGIWLNSFTSPCVTINDSISSASAEAVTLIAAGATQNGTHVAEATSSSNADAGKFKLLNSNTNQGSLNVGKNDKYIVVIGSVSLPAVAIWQSGDTFTLGENHILQGGTYFSVFVEGGYFTVPSQTLTGAQFDMAIPYSADGSVTYKDAGKGETLSTTEKYKYIQFKSSAGTISSTAADAYLAEIVFHGTNVTVNVNLQTVPFSEITAADVTYFNGSFYKIVNFSSNDKSWDSAYNAAKADSNKFNGLHGYLMTITSDIENKFIYDRVYKNKGVSPANATGWIGATRGINKSGNYDASTWSFASSRSDGSGNSDSSSLRAAWYWACGPEAGQQFYTTRKYADSGSGRYNGMYTSWNNPTDFRTNGIGTGGGAEPNNSSTEYCAQYVGTYCWNDLSHNKSGTAGQYVPGSYIVEYSVYKNAYNEEKASSTALSDSKTYSH